MSSCEDGRVRALIACTLGMLALTPACPAVDGKNVVIGDEIDALNVSECAGSKTQCTKDANTESLAAKEVLQCEHEAGSELVLDWEAMIEPTPCMDSATNSCSLAPQVAVASDGSAWVVTTYDDYQGDTGANGVWLGHYDAHGALIGGTTVTAETQPATGATRFVPDLAIKDDGHVVVAVYAIDMVDSDSHLVEHVLVHEYDEAGRGLGTAITLSGISLSGISGPHVAIAADGDVILAANGANNAHHGVLTRLSSTGKVVFNQTNLDTDGQATGVGVVGVTVDSKQRISVLMTRSGGKRLGVTQFDAHGDPIWDREIETMAEGGTSAYLAIDADDNLIMQSFLSSDIPGDRRGVIAKLSPQGQLLFQMELGPEFELQLAIARANEILAQGPGNAGLLEIAADGSSCVQHAAPPLKRAADGSIMLGEGYYSFEILSGGEIYFTTNYKIGRYKAIADE